MISAPRRASGDRTPSAPPRGRARRHDETLAEQMCAAVGYATVVITVLIGAMGQVTDDFGLGQAAVAVGPIALVSLWSIRRRSRRDSRR